ncbi:hypothetical protein [Streptomyces agglomeratus]|uniref:hypothetical protein n=1 Tax=Streptomyces agglomeratus TaxID=285458 RepID=UPI00114C8828|nr:hypothetical protein [Streptomyces agglomeratus]
MPQQHYLDVREPAIGVQPGADKDFLFYGGWIQRPRMDTGEWAAIGIINDTDIPRCVTRSAQMAGETMSLTQVRNGQSICVLDESGKWAILKILHLDVEVPAASSVKFRITFPVDP